MVSSPAVSDGVYLMLRPLSVGQHTIHFAGDFGPGSFALTEHGALLLKHADALWERLRLAEAQLGEPIAGGRRRLRIGAFPSVLATLVPAAIAG